MSIVFHCEPHYDQTMYWDKNLAFDETAQELFPDLLLEIQQHTTEMYL